MCTKSGQKKSLERPNDRISLSGQQRLPSHSTIACGSLTSGRRRRLLTLNPWSLDSRCVMLQCFDSAQKTRARDDACTHRAYPHDRTGRRPCVALRHGHASFDGRVSPLMPKPGDHTELERERSAYPGRRPPRQTQIIRAATCLLTDVISVTAHNGLQCSPRMDL
jgi:hypothetical protein